MGLLLLTCAIMFVLCAMWVAFQLQAYEACVKVVEEVDVKSLKDYRQKRTSIDIDILWADLMQTYQQSECIVVLCLDWNVEMIYMTIKLAEVILLTSEFKHPECSSSVAMANVPFSYPYYSDLRILRLNAIDQVQSLRNEIESVRYVQDGNVLYEKEINKLAITYARVLNKFNRLQSTTAQISAVEANFQSVLRTFPYNILAKVFPRLAANLVPQMVEIIEICATNLQKRPVYVWEIRTMSEEEYEQWQQQQAQQQRQLEQGNINIALHAQ